MKITKPCVVAITWNVQDTLGEIISLIEQPTEFLVGGIDLLPKIEQTLLEHKVGDQLHLHLEPQDAFGQYHKELVTFENRALFPESIEQGLCIESSAMPNGVSANIVPDQIYTITDLYPEHIVLDANHPLAGIAIVIKLTIHNIRPATQEEIQRQSVTKDEIEATITQLPKGTVIQ